MYRTPPRPHLLTDPTIARKILLYYSEDGIDVVRDITNVILDKATVDQLNRPELNPRVAVKLSPDDPANAPLIYEYFIKRFHPEHSQYERVMEVRFEPWPEPLPTTYKRSDPPTRVFLFGMILTFAPASVKLVTTLATPQDDSEGGYEITARANVNLATGIITL